MRTDMTKLTVAFRNSANVPNNISWTYNVKAGHGRGFCMVCDSQLAIILEFFTRCFVTSTVNPAPLNKLKIKLTILWKVKIGNNHLVQHLVRFVVVIMIVCSICRCIPKANDTRNKPIIKHAVSLHSVSSLSRDASYCDFPFHDLVPMLCTHE